MEKLKDELSLPVTFLLSEEDKKSIVKTTPIVFLTPVEVPSFSHSQSQEYGIERRLVLGEEISGIATDPKEVDGIKEFLNLQGLAEKVKVISFSQLVPQNLI